MGAIFKREFKSYFASPIGFIYLAAMYFFLGLYFWMTYSYGAAVVPEILTAMVTIIMFIIPVITMRSLAEDKRQKVDQALFTAPIKVRDIVFGKFFAALVTCALGFAPTLIFEIIDMCYVSVNFLSYLYALVGMLLFCAVLIAIGMFISSLTESTAIAGIGTLVANFILMFLPSISSLLDSSSSSSTSISVQWVANIVTGIKAAFAWILNGISVTDVMDSFAEEIIDFTDVVYLASFAIVFIFLTIRSLDKRRWA